MKIEELIKQTKFVSPLQKAVLNLIYTYNWHVDQAEALFKPLGITMQQFNVLRILRGKYPEFVQVGDVKVVMLDKNPDLTRLCDRLQEKGLIERETNACNRRQVLLRIAKPGLELLEKVDPMMLQHAKKYDNLSDEEAELLSDLLDKLRG
ncbi:MarR family winged helix-turn-helix transcriptional regulator [Haliscomenobacter sp.]|uniref:MarR family winged helix-turn-helix transcriptional regulator n=1 Tax=Haliscomenobacter sp. TaxID=2717303 RepID=UPI003594663F